MCLTRRYLALHNYSISVTDVVNQISRPAEKASYVAAEEAYSTTDAGSTADFIYYLKTGMLMLKDASLLMFCMQGVSGLPHCSVCKSYVCKPAWPHNPDFSGLVFRLVMHQTWD